MIISTKFKVASMIITVAFLITSFSVPVVLADDGDSSETTEFTYLSTGRQTGDYDTFAGGSACCGCGVDHYGTLPSDFPECDMASVTFYAGASRANSYYTTIVNGPTTLKLVFNDPESEESFSSIATSVKVTTETLPVDVPWYITFEFEPAVHLKPGIEWELVDGDNNIYSALYGLHSSDIDTCGLPGTSETYNCQYARAISPVYYTVTFRSSGAISSPLPVCVNIIIEAEDYDTSKDFNLISSGKIVQSTATGAELTYDFDVPAEACYVMQMRLKLSENIIGVYLDGDEKHRGEIPAHDQLLNNPYNLSTWDTWDIGLGTLTAGSHTLTVKAVSYRHGGQEFDWYKILSLPQSPVRLPSTYHEQEQGKSCFAAVAHSFILDYGGKNISEIDFCIDTFGQTKGRLFYKTGLVDWLWFFDNYEKGLEKHSGLTLTRDDTITWDEIVDSIDKGKPIIASIQRKYFEGSDAGGTHCVQIMGYGRELSRGCSDWQIVYILNPSSASGSPYQTSPNFLYHGSHYMTQSDINKYLHKAWRVE